MKPPLLPENETARLDALARFDILDTAPEPDFDALARIASELMGTPIALVSLVDLNRQWFKARVGLDATETPRAVSFCGHAVADEELLVVSDSLADERFVDNPLVTGEPYVRFYAGAPLRTSDGYCLGTLCTIDHRPRQPTEQQLSALQDLAQQVVNQLELRRRARSTEAALLQQRELAVRMERQATCLARLHGISARRGDSLDVKLRDLLRVGVETLGLESAIIGRFSEHGVEVEVAIPEADDGWVGQRLQESCAERVRRSGVVVAIPSLAEADPDSSCRREHGIECFVGAPLVRGDEVVGLVALLSRAAREEPFGEADLTVVRIIRDWVATESDRQRVKAALREDSLRELIGDKLQTRIDREALFHAARDMLVVGNFAGYFTELNPAAERILGYRIDELTSRPYVDFIHPDDVERTVTAARDAVEGGGRSDFENRYRRKDGTYVWLLWSLVGDRDRKVVYATARDITERKQVEQLKSEFVSTVSHELRTPLTSIRGSLGLLLGGAVGEISSEARPLLEMACNNTDRLVRLINDMLDVDKIESGKLRLSRDAVDLRTIVGNAIEANLVFAAQHGVRYQLEQVPPSAMVAGDADRLTQVMDNLLSNAAKYAPGSGDVEVRVADEDGAWRVEVVDHGPGIPAAFHAQIFERFSQADASSTRSVGGSGLGLNIVRSIVRMHGGEIGFRSEEGQGTTFWFRLPMLVGSEPSHAEPVAAPVVDEAGQILVIEDDPDIARLISLMLERRAMRCVVAPDSATAIAALEQGSFAAITLDLKLGGESGTSLYRRVRDRFGAELPPVIVVSANVDAGKVEIEGEAIGIVDWISKPIDAERLQRAVQGAMANAARARVLHVEDDRSLAEVTRRQLSAVAMVESVPTIEAARLRLAEQAFDLVIVDLALPDGHGRSLIEEIKASANPMPIVVYSGADLDQSLEALASAVLVKTRDSAGDLLATIDRLLDRVV